MAETIDMTATWQYNMDMAYSWKRDLDEILAAHLHHTAGFYGPPLTVHSSKDQEVLQISRMADDHRGRFGIGPGYHYVVAPSGRKFAVGKAGTRRAHVKGRSALLLPGASWNRISVGVVAFGDYDTMRPTPELLVGLREVFDEIQGWAPVGRNLRVFAHGTTPTVNSKGEGYQQGTACPGRYLLAALAEQDLQAPRLMATNDRFAEGEVTGWNEAITEMEGHLRVMRDETP